MRLKKSGEHGELATDKTLRKLRRDAGDNLEELLIVMDADNRAHAPGHDLPYQIDGIRQRYSKLQTETQKPTLPVTGYDVLALVPDRKPGPWVKETLAFVEEAWLENPSLTKDEALQIINSNLIR